MSNSTLYREPVSKSVVHQDTALKSFVEDFGDCNYIGWKSIVVKCLPASVWIDTAKGFLEIYIVYVQGCVSFKRMSLDVLQCSAFT